MAPRRESRALMLTMFAVLGFTGVHASVRFPTLLNARRADSTQLLAAITNNLTTDPYGSVVMTAVGTADSVLPSQWLVYEAERFIQHTLGLQARPNLTAVDSSSPAACGVLRYSEDCSTPTVVRYNASIGEDLFEERTIQPVFGQLCWLTARAVHSLPAIDSRGGAGKAQPAMEAAYAPHSTVLHNVTHHLLMSASVPDGDISVYSYSYGCGLDGHGACSAPVTGTRTGREGTEVNSDGSVQTEGAPEAMHAPIPVRLVSFNVWNVNPPSWLWRDPRDRARAYSFRMFGLADTLAQSGADIVAFQEVRYDSMLGGWDDPAHKPSLASNPVFSGTADAGAAADALLALEAMDDTEDGQYGTLMKPARGQTNDFNFAHSVSQYWYNWTTTFTSNPRFTERGRNKWHDVLAAEGWTTYGAPHPTEGSACAVDFKSVVAEGAGCSPYTSIGLAKRAEPSRARVQRAIRRHPHAQVMHLSALLPEGWHFAYQPASLYLDRTPWTSGVQQRDEEGPAIFSRWPIIGTHGLLLSRNTSDEGDGHQRLCLHAAIQVPKSNAGDSVTIDVYTIHLSLAEAARNRSVPELIAFIGETATGAAVMLTGDMNAEPHEPAMRAFLHGIARDVEGALDGSQAVVLALPDGRSVTTLDEEEEGELGEQGARGQEGKARWRPSLRDSWLESGYPEPPPRSGDAAVRRYGLTFPSDAPTKRIDMVLASDGPLPATKVAVQSSWLLGQDALPGTDANEGRGTGMVSEQAPIYPSDHRAVVVDVRVHA